MAEQKERARNCGYLGLTNKPTKQAALDQMQIEMDKLSKGYAK